MKKEDENTKSRTQIINEYIQNANVFINVTQNAINKPIFENFDKAQKEYTVWLFTLYTFINDFDKKKAEALIASPDGVDTPLNALSSRLNNVATKEIYFTKDEKGVYYTNESGIRNLENIIRSYKEKIDFLNRIKLEISGGILSDKDTKKPTIIFYKSGRIKTSVDDSYIQKRKFSKIIKIVNEIRYSEGVKLAILAKKLNSTEPNISRDISNFNKEIIKKFGLKEEVIITESGYCMNKNNYIFHYEDINDL